MQWALLLIYQTQWITWAKTENMYFKDFFLNLSSFYLWALIHTAVKKSKYNLVSFNDINCSLVMLVIEAYCQKLPFHRKSKEHCWGAPKGPDINRFEGIHIGIHTHHQVIQPKQQLMNCHLYEQTYMWRENEQFIALVKTPACSAGF